MQRVGDEYHFLLECPELQELRNDFLPHFFTTKPGMYKFQQLMSSQDGKVIINMFKCIKVDSTIFNYTYNINNNLPNYYIILTLLNISTNVCIF